MGADIADFNITATSFPTYDIRVYTGGCYFFNESSEEWEGGGLEVDAGGDNIWTSCSTLHLSSFGTGFFPTINKVNFEFISSDFDLEDNVTIFMVLLVSVVMFFITLIWATMRDKKDIEEVSKVSIQVSQYVFTSKSLIG